MSTGAATLEITGVAAGGDGVGRSEGMVIFVPRTAKGDVARIRYVASKRFARGEIEAIERASPDRIVPACPHYTVDDCGGCQLQHLSYDAQLSAKGAIIGDSLRRIGRRAHDDVLVQPSAAQWRYRRKLTLHLRRSGDEWMAGLHPYNDVGRVFDLKDCPITDERVMRAWDALRPHFDLLPDEAALRMSVRLMDKGVAVVVEGGTSWRTPEEFFASSPTIQELWWKPENARRRQLHSRDASTHGASFVQVNADTAATIHVHVLERTRAHAPATVIDAYAGSGATAIALSRNAAVTAIELDARAVEVMRASLAAPSVAIAGSVEDHIQRALPADVVLLNPPRTGVDARVTHALETVKRAPRAIIYVSCDPATLARDIARLSRYEIVGVSAYDMFPQTAHVETVCELVPRVA